MKSHSESPLAPKSNILHQPFLILLTVATLLLAACGGGASESENTGDGMPSSSPADTAPPSVTITGPTSASSYSTGSATLNLNGIAADNVGVTRVTWVNSRGGSGTATGTTSWSIVGITLQGGTNTLAVTARDAAGNNTTDTLVVTYSTGTPGDTIAPSIAISSPTTGTTYTTTSGTLILAGSASDNVGVTQVTWSNNRGGSGSASGTTSWTTGNITLQGGSNVITVTAVDAGGNVASDTLTVTYNVPDTTAPSISITSPTSGSSYTTTSATLSLGGTAADNVGVTQVTWSNNRGGSGSASGTTSWSVGGITLQGGSNVITVTARDAAGNQNTDTLTVTYNVPDTTPPTVSSTNPASGASGVPTGISISVTFSETMNASSIHSGTFYVGGVSGGISVSGATATFTPAAALAGTTSYTVTIVGGANGVKDAAGNALASNHVWSFTTAAPDDCASPTVHCVDDTAGATREYSTIQAAANVTLPGDTVLVYDGNYAGFQVTRSGTKNLPVVYRVNGPNVVINSNGPTGDGIRLQDVSHVTIDGFQIRGVSDRCIAARGATVDSPMTSNIVRNNTCTNAGTECVYVSQFSNALIENNVLSNCGTSGALKSHGIYLANAGSDNTVIRGNTIFDATPAESQGIHINGDASIGGDGIVSGLTIENNVIRGMAVNALSMDGVQDSLIRNNLFYGNGRHAVRAYQGDASEGPAGLRFVNNTFNGSGGWAIKISEDGGGHTVFNNILLGSSGSLCVGSRTLASNNNAVTNQFSFDDESSVVGLSTWRTQTGGDANSLVSSTSSLFVNAAGSNYRLGSGSPAIDAGRSSLNGVSAPGTDLAGASRPQGAAHDMGAYETAP